MDRPPARGSAKEPCLVLVTGLPGTGKSTVAEVIAHELGVSVLAHDWAMSGLRPFPTVQGALDHMEPWGHRVVGWSVLNALARAQLRQGRSVVLDGVARSPEIEDCRRTAQSESARLVLIETRCSDVAVHRSRIEGRQRGIPNWYELDWSQVERSIATWEQTEGVDLAVDTVLRWEANEALLRALFV
jgi:predicted kinase